MVRSDVARGLTSSVLNRLKDLAGTGKLSATQIADVARQELAGVDDATKIAVRDVFLERTEDAVAFARAYGVSPTQLAEVIEGVPTHVARSVVEPTPVVTAAMVRRVTNVTRDLVRIPSQGGIDDPKPICDALMGQCRAAGLQPELLLGNEGQAVGVVATIRGAQPGPTYALDAVVDTAPVGDPARWSASPFSGQTKKGRMYGRGTGDSKVAGAIFVEVGRQLQKRTAEMSGNLVLFFDAAEHTGKFEGVKAFLDKFPETDGVIIGYPGDDALHIGSRGFDRVEVKAELQSPGSLRSASYVLSSLSNHPVPNDVSDDFGLPPKRTLTAVKSAGARAWVPAAGSQVVDITVRGAAYHSGSSKNKGVNAVEKAADLLGRLASMSGSEAKVISIDGGKGFSIVPDKITLRVAVPSDLDVSELVGATDAARPGGAPSSVDATQPATEFVDANCALQVVDSLSFNVDTRTTPSFDGEASQAHLTEALAGHAVEVDATDSWPAFSLAADHPLRQTMEGAIEAESQSVPSKVSGPSNVGNLLASHGIPSTTGYGVGFDGMHATDESIDLSTLPQALAVHLRAAFRLMKMAES